MQPDADHLAEGNQTFAIRLYESPVGEGFGIPPLATAQFTIVDDDSALAGDQRFHLIGAGAFSHDAGKLRVQSGGGLTVVPGDVDGDGRADFSVALQGQVAPGAGDFIL